MIAKTSVSLASRAADRHRFILSYKHGRLLLLGVWVGVALRVRLMNMFRLTFGLK